VANALIERAWRQVPILLHSANSFQAPKVARRLEAAHFEVTRRPFHELTATAFLAWLEEACDGVVE